MAKGYSVGSRQTTYWGGILVALGLATIYADLAFLAPTFAALFASARVGFMALVPALGMSVMNATRALALHEVSYFHLASRILVLFSALVAVVVGTSLWTARPASTAAPAEQTLPASTEGDR